MKIAIVKYNAGNIQSVIYALNRLGIDPVLTDNAEELASADKVIFPGVGEASTAMSYLKAAQLDKVLPELKQPMLGVCIGLQLMCSHSEEGDTKCLNIFPQEVRKFQAKEGFKIPHMGWNNLDNLKTPLFRGVKNHDSFVYYVHSFAAELSDYTIGSTDYAGVTYSAALHRDNFYAVQFHPEKSGVVGEGIIKNFIDIKNT